MRRLFPLLMTCTSVALGVEVAPSHAQPAAGCLASGNGYLRARIRGALDLDLHWRNADIVCEGAVRPDRRGIRLAFAGPLQSDGRRLRFVFGITNAAEGRPGRALPANLTVIFEGENRLFATRGDDKCTVDELRHERFGELSGAKRSYRVVARGFCTAPAASADLRERIVVSRFDFAGRVVYDDAVAAPAGRSIAR